MCLAGWALYKAGRPVHEMDGLAIENEAIALLELEADQSDVFWCDAQDTQELRAAINHYCDEEIFTPEEIGNTTWHPDDTW
jgi:hypothetical protein